MKKNVLLILGMHRSGTSLLTNFLHKAGLNIGSNLLGSGVGNDKGHFEDLDILRFHNAILHRNNNYYLLKESNSILNLTAMDHQSSTNILELKLEKSNHFVFKDPRTCLFLDLWTKKKEYNFHFIVIYRHFDFVCDSLFRRDKKQLKSLRFNLNKLKTIFHVYLFRKKRYNLYLQNWIIYNRCILNFIEKSGNVNNMLIYRVTDFINNSNNNKLLIDFLNDNNYPLKNINFKEIIDSKLFNNKADVCNFPEKLISEANLIFNKLEAINSNSDRERI